MQDVRKVLEKFRDLVIKDAKKELVKQGKKSSGKLYNTINGEVEVYRTNNFRMYFELGDYGEFVDKGVRGTKKGRWKTPFRFGTGSGKKGGLRKGIEKWIKQKGIKGRDKKGRYITDKSLTFLISRSIYQRGLKPSLYFTKPFNKHFKNLSDDIVEAFGLEVDEFLKYTLNKNE